MITTGVLGGTWRADITPWGGLRPREGMPLEWYVAADDRWHVPAMESAVRQRRIGGTPVAETRVRIPGGDAIQRMTSVAGGGGFTLIELTNDSALPIAVAFDSDRLVSLRQPADVPIAGIDLPAHSRIFPIAHRASLTVALPHGSARTLPAGLPGADAVVRGWTAAAERAARFTVPGGRLGDDVTAARCEALLAGPGDPHKVPVEFLVAAGQMVRMGERAAVSVDEVAIAVERLARRAARGWEVEAAFDAAAEVLSAAGERRALGDLETLRGAHSAGRLPGEPPPGSLAVAWVEQTFADRRGRLLGGGWPAGWLGVDVEAHGVPVGHASRVSYAIRWHGERPAILWETTGQSVTLTAPAVAPQWTTGAPRGEALWPPPPAT